MNTNDVLTKLIAEIERLGRNWDGVQELQPASLFQADLYELLSLIDSLQQEQPEVFDTLAFQKGVQEGKRLEREDIRQEIERRKKEHMYDEMPITIGRYYEDRDLLAFIDSLQQEQPEFPTTDEQVKEFLAANPKIEVPEKYKNPDWLFKQQEQPEVDCDELDEAAQAYANGPDVAWVGTSALECAFKAGAKWQYQKDRREFAKIKAKTWCEGFDAHKEQMLKDAVEGEVCHYGVVHNVSTNAEQFAKRLNQFPDGEKVRIIIVKEEEK